MRLFRVQAVIAAFFLLVLTVDTRAATYYVDQTNGADGNNGTATTSAWKNSPGMASYAGSGSLRPGDTVYFDRSDTWLVTGTQGLYLVGGVTYVGDSWGSGSGRATIQASTDLEAGVVRFRDHATIPTILRGFHVDANNRVTSGIDMNHAFYAGPLTGATKRVQDTEVRRIASRQNSGQYKYGIIISNWGGTAGAVENVEIINTSVHDVSRDAICLYPGDNSASSRIRNITVRGSEVYNTGQDPDYCCGAGVLVKGYVQDAFIENNYIHDVKGASVFINSNETNHYGVGQTNIHVRHNIITNSTSNGAIRIYDGASGGDPKDIKIYGNIVYNSTVNGGLLIGSDLKHSLDLRVYNNTFFNAPVIVGQHTAFVNTFEFKNNIVYYAGGIPLTDQRPSITAHSNNLFFRGGGTLVHSGGTNYSASNLVSFEPTGSRTNPRFVNVSNLPTGFSGLAGVNFAPNQDGLRLQATSTGIDQGATLSDEYSTSINSVIRPPTGGWDVGAYESGTTILPPTAPTNLRVVQ